MLTIDQQIRNERVQSDINRETPRISALSSGRIEKYKYLTGD